MAYYKNHTTEVIETVNGCEIVKCVAQRYDPIMGEWSGHKRVFYDVVIDDVLLDSFTTIQKARLFAKAYN